MSVNKFKYENCKINKAEIRSNVDGATVNLDAAADLQYSESMFSDTIEVDIKNRPKFNAEAVTALTKHNWPGNVRELKNLIERASILFPGKEITSTNIFKEAIVF